MQTRKPDFLLIWDDGDKKNLSQNPLYQYLFALLDREGIKWFVGFGEGKGQHICHQKTQDFAKNNGCKYVWRIDDDEIAQYNCLEILEKNLKKGVVASAGLVIDPKNNEPAPKEYSKDLDDLHLPNYQWHKRQGKVEVKHLYSSFLYEVGLADYNLLLSQVAHREETMFSHELSKKGKLIIDSKAITWHLRNPEGGIREETDPSLWEHDEQIFQYYKKYNNKKLAVLNNGLGDHIVFKKAFEKLKPDVIAVCYPNMFKDEDVEIISIAEAQKIDDINKYDLYRYIDTQKYKKPLYEAYMSLYATLWR